MIKVEVKSANVDTKEGVSKKSGQPYKIREQELWVHLGQAYPVRIVHSLGNDASPYPVGVYTLGTDAFRVSRFGALEVDMRKLRSSVAEVKRA